MLSKLIKTTQTNAYLLNNYERTTTLKEPLVNIQYQDNDYQVLLAHIQNGPAQGWILFLAPPGKPNAQFFQQAGIDKNRVLMIDSNKIKDNLELLSTLLKSNNYCTVVTWVNTLTKDAHLSIEAHAKSTNTSCFIYCKQ